jgi:hypothetical protein
MSDIATSTIAQLLFVKRPQLNFAHVVSELDAALSRYPADRRSLGWDCDDVAVFDLDGTRIALGYAEDLDGDHAACLTVSVGPGPGDRVSGALARRRATFCRLIVNRLTDRYASDTILWKDLSVTVTPDVIDRLLDDLPDVEADTAAPVDIDRLMARMTEELDQRMPPPETELLIEMPKVARGATPGFWAAISDVELPFRITAARQRVSATVQPAEAVAPTAVANDVPDLPPLPLSDLDRIRRALYAEEMAANAPKEAVAEGEPASVPMRLAVHAMNATLITVYAPVGAAVMTYSILRGEDMRLSGRMMALTGALLALSQSPMGQQMMAMI